ncbi:hypothetical protein ACFLU5_08505 [Bacteroidota bacterium]
MEAPESIQSHSYEPAMFNPNAGDSYGHGWETMKSYILELLLILIVYGIISIPSMITSFIADEDLISTGTIIMFLVGLLYSLFILGPLSFTVSYAFLKAVRKEKTEVKDLFDFSGQFGNALLANILVGFIVGLGVVFFIIPGIVFACKLAFVPYLVMDKKLDSLDAIKESWQMTNGHGWTIFAMALLAIPIGFVGLLLIGVGIVFAYMWIGLAFAALYYAVDTNYRTDANVE